MSSPYLDSLFSLDGRTAVITGGSSGIGFGIAKAIASAGAHVVLIARRTRQLAEAVDALTAAGLKAEFVVADLSTREGAHTAADDVLDRFGGPDILVNSAGVNIRPPMPELNEDDWDRTMRLNLEAPFILSQRFTPDMLDRGYGRLIHVSSQQAHRAFVSSGAYGVSKGALESLMRSQAEAYSARGVTANTLVPGFVLTPLNARLQGDPAKVSELAARTMVGRNGLPDDFATAALFLASPASSYVTGQSIFVDGGLSVH